MATTPEITATESFATSLEHGRGSPDARALALAGELQDRMRDAQVLLFGSRAMGNWRPDSDIDLAVIGGDADAAEEALAQATGICAELYAGHDPFAQLFHLTPAEFAELRTSLPHIAGQMQRHGLKPNGEPLPCMKQDNHWDGVRNLLQTCRRDWADALESWGVDNPRRALASAHGAIEVAIKAALGASGIDITDKGLRREKLRHHLLVKLGNRLPAALEDQLHALLPPTQLVELTRFRITSPYAGEHPTMPPTDAQTLMVGVQKASLMLATYALTTLDKGAHDVGYAEWVGNDALAGFGSVELDYYAQPEIEARAEQRAELGAATRILRGVLTPRQLDQVGEVWTGGRVPSDAVERALAVRDNPALWRTLLAEPDDRPAADRERDDDRPPPGGAW